MTAQLIILKTHVVLTQILYCCIIVYMNYLIVRIKTHNSLPSVNIFYMYRYVVVAASARVTWAPRVVVVRVGASVRLRCGGAGSPPLHWRWTAPASAPPAARLALTDTSELLFHSQYHTSQLSFKITKQFYSGVSLLFNYYFYLLFLPNS